MRLVESSTLVPATLPATATDFRDATILVPDFASFVFDPDPTYPAAAVDLSLAVPVEDVGRDAGRAEMGRAADRAAAEGRSDTLVLVADFALVSFAAGGTRRPASGGSLVVSFAAGGRRRPGGRG